MPAFKRLVAFLILAFVLLLALRFVLGYFYEFERNQWGLGPAVRESKSYLFSSIEYDKAVYNNRQALADAPLAEQIGQIEVFAKEARLTATTRDFQSAEADARAAIDQHEALIRIERKQGLKPDRSVQFVIRVAAERFAGLVDALRALAPLESFSVNKEDRSGQARLLIIEKQSLTDYRDSLQALRQADGEVADLLALEEKIQQIQRQIEQLQANVTGMVGQRSYHNISYDLAEKIPFFVDKDVYPVGARVADALLWTMQWYMLGALLLFVLLAVLWSVRALFAPAPSRKGIASERHQHER